MTAESDQRLAAAALGDDRTIGAVATAPGRGALAMVRLSGPRVQAIAERLLRPTPTEPRRAVRTRAVDPDHDVLDEVVAVFYRAPHSFTGEDLLEITTHGGSFIATALLAAAIRSGARLAEPGEFTRRAVLNGKIDLLQAEAIGDLIDARSTAAHRAALRQLDGELSRRIADLRTRMLDVRALLAYDIDFPEEDDGPIPRERILRDGDAVLRAVESLLATADRGTLLHDGALIVFAGAPNAGKSSLFNALLGEARAIVTDVPGTTRDAIEAILDRPHWPLRLVDTAGLRSTNDPLERLGIETASRYLAHAALVLACGEDRSAIDEVRNAVRGLTTAPVLGVRTKCDLVAHRYEPAPSLVSDSAKSSDVVRVSARTGEGVAELLDAIDRRLGAPAGGTLDATVGLTHARHRAAVAQAAAELRAFCAATREDRVPPSIAALHITAAAAALDDLIGVIHTEDVLDVVFRRFCVGK